MTSHIDQDEAFVPTLRLTASEVSQLPTACCTLSVGADEGHDLLSKIQAISAAKFKAIELGFPDLCAFAKEQLGSSFAGEEDYDALEQVAATVHTKCQELGLYVATIMPFGPFGGFASDAKRQKAWDKAEGWFRIIHALGGPLLQCGTSDEPDASTDIDDYVTDLQQFADKAATRVPPVKIAFEQWCWGRLNTWQDSWQAVKRADRPNLGLCLDTFQLSGIAYADPTSENGLNSSSEEQSLSSLNKALADMEDVDPAKIFYVQVSSATRMSPPLNEKHPAWNDSQPPRGIWSDSFRPMPFTPERNSYLPVMSVVEAILRTGYRGLWSVETFDMEVMKKPGENVPVELASAAHFKLVTRVLGRFAQDVDIVAT